MNKKLLILVSALISYSSLAKEHIVISAFDPFSNRKDNNSWNVALELNELSKKQNDIKVTLCLLPTVYDEASEVLQDCVRSQKIPVTKVISLGENSCRLYYETVAYNQDSSSYADNNGVVKNNSEIISGASKALGMTLPVHKMSCAKSKNLNVSDYVKLSDNPGRFVCNNTSYRSLINFQSDIPFTFVHVPRTDCNTDFKDPNLIAKIVWTSINEISSTKNRGEGPLGLGKNVVTMPTSFKEANKMYKYLKAKSAPKCEQDFFKKIRYKLLF